MVPRNTEVFLHRSYMTYMTMGEKHILARAFEIQKEKCQGSHVFSVIKQPYAFT